MQNAIAIDIGGTTIKYALINNSGTIHYESSAATTSDNGEAIVIPTLKKIIRELLQHAGEQRMHIAGIGIGVPSVVDNGMVLFANNLMELNNHHLDAIIQQEFNLPVFVDNDANLMGLGEVKYGAAANISDAVFLTIGTGIGGALILNGKLYGGYRNRGTELGFIILDAHTDDCGMKGSFEAKASVTALINDYKSILTERNVSLNENIDGKYIVTKYLQQEGAAITAMNRHFHYMAAGIASLINVFAPQKVIIGGGISEAGSFYCDNIRKQVKQMVMQETSEFTEIELASLGNKAGCLGAAAMVFEKVL